MTSESPPDTGVVLVSQELSIRQSQEPGVLISKRQYRRYLERLEGCKSHGWSDFWLAGAGIGGGLATAALVTALALPSTGPATDYDILWMLVILGGIVLVLCLLAYFTQRHHHKEDIDDLKRDLEMHLGETDLASDDQGNYASLRVSRHYPRPVLDRITQQRATDDPVRRMWDSPAARETVAEYVWKTLRN